MWDLDWKVMFPSPNEKNNENPSFPIIILSQETRNQTQNSILDRASKNQRDRYRAYSRITNGGQRVSSESTEAYVTNGEWTVLVSAIILESVDWWTLVLSVNLDS